MKTDFDFELSVEILGSAKHWIDDAVKEEQVSAVEATKDVCEEHELLKTAFKLLISHEELEIEKVEETFELAWDIKGMR